MKAELIYGQIASWGEREVLPIRQACSDAAGLLEILTTSKDGEGNFIEGYTERDAKHVMRLKPENPTVRWEGRGYFIQLSLVAEKGELL